VSAKGYLGRSQVNCSSIFRRRVGILDEPICSLSIHAGSIKALVKQQHEISQFFQIACHLGRYWDGVFCLVGNQASKLKVSVVGSYCCLACASASSTSAYSIIDE
jgi:hypothetical protein